MEKKLFCIASKEEVNDRPIKAGKKVLQSYAQTPIWKAFYWTYVQFKKPLWAEMDEKEAKRVLHKYANSKDYEIVPVSLLEKQFSEYTKNLKK